jgi:hypothetical protein
MIYITQKASPRFPQYTLEDFLSDKDFVDRKPIYNENNTRTTVVDELNDHYRFLAAATSKTAELASFNRRWDRLRSVPRSDLYDSFNIPKKHGGLRRINAPKAELSAALYELKAILENQFNARWLYHTSAFAYIKNRCTLDAVKRHQQNESRWFLKLDLHDFFGSTTLDFVMKQLSMVYPFCEVIRLSRGEQELRKALELGFLDGGLPQGTPLSPLITNIMMIPIDHALSAALRDYERNSFVYTRYADDFIISSRYSFRFKGMEELVIRTLASFEAPFSLNTSKTRYGSRNGSNWNLGVMLNKDNQITVGGEKKRNFRAMLSSYAADRKNGIGWPTEDIQIMQGLYSYYRMVEKECIDEMVSSIGAKYGINIIAQIKKDLNI